MNALNSRAESLDVSLAVHPNDFAVQPNTEIALLLEKFEKLTRFGVWRDGNPESDENGIPIRRRKVGAANVAGPALTCPYAVR